MATGRQRAAAMADNGADKDPLAKDSSDIGMLNFLAVFILSLTMIPMFESTLI